MNNPPIPVHATQDYVVAHKGIFIPAVTAAIMSNIPNIAKAVGEYLSAAARSHPIMRGGHSHSVITRVIMGSYSFVLTLEEGHKDHPHVTFLPYEPGHIDDLGNHNVSIDVSGFAKWYWHFSVIRVHEDTGAMLPMPLDEAIKLAEMILMQEIWPEWFHYGVNPAEPLVIHGFIPYREETEDGI